MAQMQSQTSFETARGIASVEYQKGYSLIVAKHHGGIEKVLAALKCLSQANLSFDSLKLAEDYFSFIVKEEMQEKAVELLTGAKFEASHHRSKAILKVTAPNIRDDSGLVARIAEIVVSSGATIYEVGDMNDGLELVIQSEKAEATAQALRECIGKVEIL